MSNKNTNEPKITFHHQPDGEKSIGKRISDLAETADKIWIASAFLTEGGLKLLGNVSEKCKEINIICAMHGGASDIKALEDWVNENIGIKKKVSVYDKRMFHPKIYYFVNGNETTVLIGSGNFTQKGTTKSGNVETMVELKDQNIPNGIFKFLTTSFNNGVKLKDFWGKHKDYKYNRNSEPNSEWPDNGDELSKHLKSSDILSFKGKITESFLSGEGHKTVKNKLNDDLDKYFSLSLDKNLTKNIRIIVGDKKVHGKLYRQYDKKLSRRYYQISIKGNLEKHTGKQFSKDDIVKYTLDLANNLIAINPSTKGNKLNDQRKTKG